MAIRKTTRSRKNIKSQAYQGNIRAEYINIKEPTAQYADKEEYGIVIASAAPTFTFIASGPGSLTMPAFLEQATLQPYKAQGHSRSVAQVKSIVEDFMVPAHDTEDIKLFSEERMTSFGQKNGFVVSTQNDKFTRVSLSLHDRTFYAVLFGLSQQTNRLEVVNLGHITACNNKLFDDALLELIRKPHMKAKMVEEFLPYSDKQFVNPDSNGQYYHKVGVVADWNKQTVEQKFERNPLTLIRGLVCGVHNADKQCGTLFRIINDSLKRNMFTNQNNSLFLNLLPEAKLLLDIPKNPKLDISNSQLNAANSTEVFLPTAAFSKVPTSSEMTGFWGWKMQFLTIYGMAFDYLPIQASFGPYNKQHHVLPTAFEALQVLKHRYKRNQLSSTARWSASKIELAAT
ncbi:hypothetical protein PHLGIDRAFT_16790 [Phlebiopsis gigantea 11061_1 CR5-6]|uniref:Uncharacterized protein n=1 Tax=Phlebiopsis gigantea (strain 11061_1 CR5-6) TaxID=745531 RepID=A0A0C3RZU2_PHLG1|nr:hypothetical protein PHLGIDRAFT_16790 [Phlebiopsis gigantea 11061_1 CR5-6]